MAREFMLPEALGGGRVKLVTHLSNGLMTVALPDGPQFDIHPNWLTDVPPPLPEEPTEPGLYVVNGARGAQRMPLAEGDSPWLLTGHVQFFTYQRMADLLGPNFTIRPLVPALEPVSLPWNGADPNGLPITVVRNADAPRVTIQTVDNDIDLYDVVAAQLARALLTAAGDLP